MATTLQPRVTLQDWFWRALFRSAIVPLLLIELSFLGVYWLSGRFSYEANTDTVQEISHKGLNEVFRPSGFRPA